MGLVKMAPDGWAYYATEIASGREDYFAHEEPGRWLGRGADVVGLGGPTEPEGLERLFGEARHPRTGQALGRPFGTGSRAVAGYALSFSPPKSVSVLWALAKEDVAASVKGGHDAAVAAAMAYLDEHAAFTRRGKAGLLQADTDGLIAAAFVHRTSRAADPQLHTHVLVANKVKAASDGQWLSIDGTELYGTQKAAGMLYKAALRAELTTRLGVSWSEVDRNGIAEIVGVPHELIDHWSKRRQEVKAMASALIAGREAALGRSLSSAERSEAHQLAAYRTRAAKADDTRTTAELRAAWREEAEAQGFGPERWTTDALSRQHRRSAVFDPSVLVARARDILEEAASTWTRADATEVLTTLVDHDVLASAEALARAVEDGADMLICDNEVLALCAPSLVELPAHMVRRDGRPHTVRHGATRYTTRTTLAREAMVLEAAAAGAHAGLAVVPAAALEAQLAGSSLGADQKTAVRRMCLGGEALCCVTGPAGAGKSRMLEVARAAWDSAGHRVLGLAPSAMAAGVLEESSGIASETLARTLLTATLRTTTLRSGDVVILDEATMAKSAELALLVSLAGEAGAKLVAIGDPAQLGAVGAGGLFRTLANDTRAVELGGTRRFAEPWEAAAVLRLRARDQGVTATYADKGRILEADADGAVEQALCAWQAAKDRGASVVVMAADHEMVDALALRARALLVEAGVVEHEGIAAGRHVVGVGDEVVTLRNDRRLTTTSGDWVRNGDRWKVLARHGDGSLALRHLADHGSVLLPSSYVTEHLGLAYALTVHKAQGMTVDEAVVVVDRSMSGEQLYVAMSRGRHSNLAVVVCEEPDVAHGRFVRPSAEEIFARVLRRSGADTSATDVLRDELRRAEDPAVLHEALAEARREVDRQAGPDRTSDIADLEPRADVEGARRRLVDAEAACRRAADERARTEEREAEAHRTKSVMAKLPGRTGRRARHDRWTESFNAGAYANEARSTEHKTLTAVDKARHELYEARQAAEDLAELTAAECRRQQWLADHPEHLAVIDRLKNEIARVETIRTPTQIDPVRAAPSRIRQRRRERSASPAPSRAPERGHSLGR